jgi:Dual specificity phosphatase, catalytic domain
MLHKAGIGAVLNLQTDEDCAFLNIDWPKLQTYYRKLGIEVRRVPVRDFDPGDLATKLPQCVLTLQELLDGGHTVYLHCTAGIGRSPTVAIAYLHWQCGMCLDEAYRHVRVRRTCSPTLDSSAMPRRPKRNIT